MKNINGMETTEKTDDLEEMVAIYDIEYKNEADHIWEAETNISSYDNSEINVRGKEDNPIDCNINEEANLNETVKNLNNIRIKKENVEIDNNIETEVCEKIFNGMETTENTDELEEMAAIDDIEYKNEADHIWEEETNFTSYDNSEINVKSKEDDKPIYYNINEEANLRESVENVNNIKIPERSVRNDIGIEITKKTVNDLNAIELIYNLPGNNAEYSKIPDPADGAHRVRCALSFASQEPFDAHKTRTRSATRADERTVKIVPRFTEPVVVIAKSPRVELWKYTAPPEYAGVFGAPFKKPKADSIKEKKNSINSKASREDEDEDDDEQFISSDYLKTHMRMHTGEKPYSCTVCKKQFNQSGNLKTHMRMHSGEKPYSCTVCNKQFNSSDYLKTHMRTHSDEKPYSCTVCNKQFSHSSDLTKHLKTHTGEKPYSCTVCNKQFSTSKYIKIHMRTHTGEKPYSCTVCRKQFSQSNSLSRHMRIHTGEKPYSCTVCRKQFNQSNSLSTHMIIHTREKPYSLYGVLNSIQSI